MRWLKHLTDAHLDERLAAFLDEEGLTGYGFWWLLLEVVGHAVRGDQCEVTYSLPQWSRLLYSHHHRVSKYLGKLHVSGLVIAENNDGKWSVRIPNLLKYRDEYARRSGHLSGQTPDETPERVRPKKQKQKESTDTEEESPNRKRSDDALRFADDSPEMKAAKYLFSKILANNPKAKSPNFQTWARQFDLIFRVDERDRAEVRRLIDWCQADPFWLKNVLSPQTLRKQFDRLTVAMKNPAKGIPVVHASEPSEIVQKLMRGEK